ncbi:hypothetical protein ACHAXT_007071 [Thalassiosira profunda]
MVSPEPRVIACGHLRFRSKLGNEFPALLVCVPSGNGEAGYFWRAKRDFLLLDRPLRQNADALTSPFPKKAYTKLCNHAASDGGGPWVRPDDEHAPAGGYRRLVGINLSKTGAPDTTIVCSNYDPRMKKSLFQLDSFLAAAAQSTCSGVADAWSVFCRGEDSEGLTLALAARNVKGKDLPATLGQYFASAENAKAVASTVFSLLPEKTQICDVAFLEPSCGDGRIIEELLQSNEDLQSARVLGVDVDAAAIEKAKQRLSGSDKTLNQDNKQGDREWCYHNTELENSLFSFEDQVVTQPSVLQSWYRATPGQK